MKTLHFFTVVIAAGTALFLSGCQTQKTAPAAATMQNVPTQTEPTPMAQSQAPATAQTATAASTVTASAPAMVALTDGAYRVKAGSNATLTDSEGRIWLPDQGFDGGDTIDRDADTKITGTTDPALFLTEHYGMDAFSCKIPNGKYTANLYFAETFDGITGAGQRVFSFNVQGHEFKDFDLWIKAGGPGRAYVVTVPVEVTNGIFRIDFTTQVENPEINAIELIPNP